jgi:hypothetical protein
VTRTATARRRLSHSRPKAPHRRFYIDQETGIRLKTEEVGPDGRVLSSSYFLSIDLSPAFTDADFARPTPAAGRARGARTARQLPVDRTPRSRASASRSADPATFPKASPCAS